MSTTLVLLAFLLFLWRALMRQAARHQKLRMHLQEQHRREVRLLQDRHREELGEILAEKETLANESARWKSWAEEADTKLQAQAQADLEVNRLAAELQDWKARCGAAEQKVWEHSELQKCFLRALPSPARGARAARGGKGPVMTRATSTSTLSTSTSTDGAVAEHPQLSLLPRPRRVATPALTSTPAQSLPPTPKLTQKWCVRALPGAVSTLDVKHGFVKTVNVSNLLALPNKMQPSLPVIRKMSL